MTTLPRPTARIRSTETPPIPAVRAWAQAYDGRAGKAIDLTQAVPGYPAHPELMKRLAEAAGSLANAGYGPIQGEMPLREAFAADLTAQYGGPVGAADVAITAGGNLAFTMAMTTAAGTGEAVMLPTPWYFNHRMALEMLGIEAVPLPCRAEDGFVPDPALAAALWKPGIKALVLVSPNNPTGACYPAATIQALAELCRTKGAFLIIDETYRDFLPEGLDSPHDLLSAPDWRDHVVQLHSFSKSYCVPGHRAGAIVAGGAFRDELAKAIDTMQICAPRPTQAALAWAVPALKAWRQENRALMAERARVFRAAMAEAPAFPIEAQGAYFTYLRLPEGAPDAVKAAEKLAIEAGLLCLPGSFFGPGQERHLRLAFANAEAEVLREVPGRLAKLLAPALA
ncbi:aminotransferase [Acetobacteraceae bacterium H6797]|nr:aminotransferase [Acetobacteraceae bacterium H6797]